jgi:hypothetical protein
MFKRKPETVNVEAVNDMGHFELFNPSTHEYINDYQLITWIYNNDVTSRYEIQKRSGLGAFRYTAKQPIKTYYSNGNMYVVDFSQLR